MLTEQSSHDKNMQDWKLALVFVLHKEYIYLEQIFSLRDAVSELLNLILGYTGQTATETSVLEILLVLWNYDTLHPCECVCMFGV